MTKPAYHCIQPNEGPAEVAEQWTGDAERWSHLIEYNHFHVNDPIATNSAYGLNQKERDLLFKHRTAIMVVGWEPGVIIKIPPMWVDLRASFEKTKGEVT